MSQRTSNSDMVELGFHESDAINLVKPITGNQLADEIISLTDSIDDEKELWQLWKTLNSAMSYLNSKHTMASVKNKRGL